MNVQPLAVTQEAALVALVEYKAHRATHDKRDWEIERVYRQIAKGKTIISVNDAIRRGGVDELGRPKLAIMRADQEVAMCRPYDYSDRIEIGNQWNKRGAEWHFDIPWPDRPPLLHHTQRKQWRYSAQLPRIPPQHRPPAGELIKYHILWEADWTAIPRDPYLLKRIGKDAWLVLAAWDLTDVEVSVLRAHQ